MFTYQVKKVGFSGVEFIFVEEIDEFLQCIKIHPRHFDSSRFAWNILLKLAHLNKFSVQPII